MSEVEFDDPEGETYQDNLIHIPGEPDHEYYKDNLIHIPGEPVNEEAINKDMMNYGPIDNYKETLTESIDTEARNDDSNDTENVRMNDKSIDTKKVNGDSSKHYTDTDRITSKVGFNHLNKKPLYHIPKRRLERIRKLQKEFGNKGIPRIVLKTHNLAEVESIRQKIFDEMKNRKLSIENSTRNYLESLILDDYFYYSVLFILLVVVPTILMILVVCKNKLVHVYVYVRTRRHALETAQLKEHVRRRRVLATDHEECHCNYVDLPDILESKVSPRGVKCDDIKHDKLIVSNITQMKIETISGKLPPPYSEVI